MFATSQRVDPEDPEWRHRAGLRRWMRYSQGRIGTSGLGSRGQGAYTTPVGPKTALDAALARSLVELRHVISAYLFGSTADGRAHRESDVDLAILFDRARYPMARDRFEARLRAHTLVGPALHRDDLDIVVLNDAPPLFARRIVTEGRRVLCADPEGDREFRRDVMLRAADLAPFLARARRRLLDALASSRSRGA